MIANWLRAANHSRTFLPPLVRPIRRPRWSLDPLFHAHAGRCPVSLEIGCINHNGLFLAMLGGQTGHDPGKDALITPSLPSIVECLVRPILPRGITPTQPIAIYEDNPAQYASIIHPWLAVGLRETGHQTRHLRVGQPEKIRHVTTPFSEP